MHERRCAGAQKGDVPACGLKSVLNGVDQGWISGSVVPADHHLGVFCIQRSSQRLPRQPSQWEGQASLVDQGIDGLTRPTRSEVHLAADAVGAKHVHGAPPQRCRCCSMCTPVTVVFGSTVDNGPRTQPGFVTTLQPS